VGVRGRLWRRLRVGFRLRPSLALTLAPNLALGVVAHAGVGLLVQAVERAARHLRDMGRYRRDIREM